jgi:hypothetical protein
MKALSENNFVEPCRPPTDQRDPRMRHPSAKVDHTLVSVCAGVNTTRRRSNNSRVHFIDDQGEVIDAITWVRVNCATSKSGQAQAEWRWSGTL